MLSAKIQKGIVSTGLSCVKHQKYTITLGALEFDDKLILAAPLPPAQRHLFVKFKNAK